MSTYKCGLTQKHIHCVDQISQTLKSSFLPSYKGAIIQVEMLKANSVSYDSCSHKPSKKQQEKSFTLWWWQIHRDTKNSAAVMTIPPRKFLCIREVVVHLIPVWHRAVMQQELCPIK